MKTDLISDGCAYRPIFQNVTLRRGVACRLCESDFRRTSGKRHLDSEDRKKFMMKAGMEAIEMVTTSGPAGKGFLCLDHAKLVMANLKKELGE